MQLASRFSLQPELLLQPALSFSVIFLNTPHPAQAQPAPFTHGQISFCPHNLLSPLLRARYVEEGHRKRLH